MCFLVLRNLCENNPGEISNVYHKNKIIKVNKIENILGLAKKAGAITAGTELVIDSVRKKKACHIFVCSDASAGTLKKLCDKSDFYKIPMTKLALNMSELAHCVGLLRPAAAVALTNKNFLKLTEKCLEDSDDKT